MTIPNWCAYNFDNIRIGVVYPYKSGYAIANRHYGGYPVVFQSLSDAQASFEARHPFVCRWEREDVEQETPQQQADAILAKVGAVKCAWCERELVAGDPDKPVSHGICADCKPKLEQEIA